MVGANYTGFSGIVSGSDFGHSILTWIQNPNDTNGFQLSNASQEKVMEISRNLFVELPQAHEQFMLEVLNDLTASRYRAILILWRIIVPILFILIILLGTIGELEVVLSFVLLLLLMLMLFMLWFFTVTYFNRYKDCILL